MKRLRCGCGTWWCFIDSACHMLHIRWHYACDRHDEQITR